MKKLELPSMKEALPKIRAAYEKGILQAQTNGVKHITGKYSGPCAVGVVLSGTDQARLDRGIDGLYSIELLLRDGHVKTSDSPADWGKLQYAHDNWLIHPDDFHESEFVTQLERLETRYGSTSPA